MPRARQALALGAIIFLAFFIFSLLPSSQDRRIVPLPPSNYGPPPSNDGPPTVQAEAAAPIPPVSPATNLEGPEARPSPAPNGPHPMRYLIDTAEQEFEALKSRQSRTLAQAVAEYKRRYHLPPPPNFDKWWDFAQAQKVHLVDEFDTIHDLLTPFWGLKPETIRNRATETMGYLNFMVGLQIRDGKITNRAGTVDWHIDALVDMTKSFVEYLPNMDLAFNTHDEPRVVVPHDDLERLVRKAREVTMPRAFENRAPKNQFTTHPKGLNDGLRFEETKLTRFNTFAHQPTWTHSRMSCPPDSPARVLEEDEMADAAYRYAMGDLGFVYNVTAMTDVCLTPSLRETYGFFDRPNAFNIVHDLFPIFSQSKLSSFNDIIYPSPWYWVDKAPYEEDKDVDWSKKSDKLYWRGSTTGGFSRDGGWRRQHRQQFVHKINAGDKARVMMNTGDELNPNWTTSEVPRGQYKNIMDVHFSHIGQCDDGDCLAQSQFFTIKKPDQRSDAYRSRYLLDLDGNAFSGRFYAFLQSKSLVFKWALFREWHAEWLKPWAHYIPLSIRGDEWLETVRFFADSEKTKDMGRKEGEVERLALLSRSWAKQALRKEDMEVWFFRLLLEYGRVIDDNRENIGFAG